MRSESCLRLRSQKATGTSEILRIVYLQQRIRLNRKLQTTRPEVEIRGNATHGLKGLVGGRDFRTIRSSVADRNEHFRSGLDTSTVHFRSLYAGVVRYRGDLPG